MLALWPLTLVACASGKLNLVRRVPSESGQQAVFSSERETVARKALANAKCNSSLDQDDLQLGLRLGSQFLLRSQRPAGNFRYVYDWLKQTETDEDNPVRQAGTLWGLSLLHVDDPKSGLMPAIRKGLHYFGKHSVEFPGGLRLTCYPRQENQKLGSVGLLALAHIEVLRRPEALESSEEKQQLEAHLQGYLKAILAARTRNNNFHKFYDGQTGRVFGSSSPYFDGECLLALVKAAKYLGHDHLWSHIKVSAEAGWRKNVLRGLDILQGNLPEDEFTIIDREAQDNAMKHLKGYYQWSTMAWFEMMGTKDPEFEKYGQRTMRYSAWMADKVAGVDANTGYALEGLIPAFVTAVQVGNQHLVKKLACTIRDGIENLHSMQVGHTKANGLVERDTEKGKDKRALGGAQGDHSSPVLRIDTTQHQLHALLMASRLMGQQALI